ncbi:hypothetical protein Bbelb_019980 [Branchiostoma belcheri]|nr:hypothetical protein Bbelb_019980 [Branchiostoma belcheri]
MVSKSNSCRAKLLHGVKLLPGTQWNWSGVNVNRPVGRPPTSPYPSGCKHRSPRRSHTIAEVTALMALSSRSHPALVAFPWRPWHSLRALANFRSQRERRESAVLMECGYSKRALIKTPVHLPKYSKAVARCS